jgi:uncharacterized DUF497 family protein
MLIVWDEPKRLANFDKHGLDFADLEVSFDFVNAVARPVRSSLSGRGRLQLIGLLFNELVVAVVVSPLGQEALSIISLRAASAKERRLYGE